MTILNDPTIESWTESVSSKLDNRVITDYAHDWEIKYWFNVGYTPSQIAYVLNQRSDTYLKENPWWVRPE